MKIITLPVATRPHYLKQMLNTLKQNNLDGWKLYVNAEPNKDVIDVINEIDFIETSLIVNSERLGVRHNPFNVLDRAFEDGAEFVFHIEDDLILSPDALDLANWYYDTFKDNPTTHINYGMFTYESDPDRPEDINVIVDKFVGLGWCTFSDNWYNYFQPNWFNDEINKVVWGPNTWGWDWSIAAIAKTQHLTSLQPLCGRSNHIGRSGGTYCAPAFHDQTFPQIVINNELKEDLNDYRIVEETNE